LTTFVPVWLRRIVGQSLVTNGGLLELVSFMSWRQTRSVPLKTRLYLSQDNAGLQWEKRALSFKPALQLEQIAYEHSEGVQDYKHRLE
jgi:hypothetical protein